MSARRIGFVGFGEVGYHLARGLGLAGMVAYDIHADTPGRGEKIRARVGETGVRLVADSAELAASADVILCVVTAREAGIAAEQTAPYLTPEHLYVDMNSVSPALKVTIGETVAASGAKFVEVAIMAPVEPYGHKVPMISGGPHTREFDEIFVPLGMVIESGDPTIGSASASKMCRSIVVKGMEAILTECVLAATRYGAQDRVFASLGETFPGIDWAELATYMVGRVVVHGERRAHEMEEVAKTLRSIGVEPIMAEATAKLMAWSAKEGWKDRFEGKEPESVEAFAEKVNASGATERL